MRMPPALPWRSAVYEAANQVRATNHEKGQISAVTADWAGRSDTGAGPIRGQTPDQICKGKEHQGPPRRATSARSYPTPKLTVSVSLDRKEQPLPKWAWPGRSLGYGLCTCMSGIHKRLSVCSTVEPEHGEVINGPNLGDLSGLAPSALAR